MTKAAEALLADGKWQISTAGGIVPRWRADGKEIFYAAPDLTTMAAAVNGQGATFEVHPTRTTNLP